MLNLKTLNSEIFAKKLIYDLQHCTAGREGTTLTVPLEMTISDNNTLCEIEIKGCIGTTPDESLDKMATWLRRLAEGIENRNKVSIPI